MHVDTLGGTTKEVEEKENSSLKLTIVSASHRF